MGIMFAKLANPKAEFYDGMRMVDILEAVVEEKLRPPLPEQLPHTISQLLLEMWRQDATQRPCISQVVSVLCAAQDSMQGSLEEGLHFAQGFPTAK
jgi:hypothetical protein